MKKNCLIGLCAFALCHNATAGVTGFKDNALCNDCMAAMTCGLGYGYDYMQNNNSECTIADKEILSEYSDTVKETCRGTDTSYNIVDYIPVAFQYGIQFYREFECEGASANDKYVRVREHAYRFIKFCHKVGACECGAGNYILPAGVDDLLLGVNSSCNQCPMGGTSEEFDNVYITSCYIESGGAFSDDTGSGIFTDVCRYDIKGDPLDSIQ